MKGKVYSAFFSLMIASHVLSYTQQFSTVGTIFKYIISLILFTSLLTKKINYKSYKTLFMVLIPCTVIPLVLIILGIYIILPFNQILNSLSYFYFILLIITCKEMFVTRIKFLFHTQIGISLAVIFMAIYHRNEMSFNILVLLKNMVLNSRDIRVFLGFTNPNMLGLVLLIGIICSLDLMNSASSLKITLTNILLFLVYIVILANVGSRTVLFSVILGLIMMLIFMQLSRLSKIKKILTYIVLAIILLFGLAIIINSNTHLTSIDSLNTLTSNRLYRQFGTIEYLLQRKILVRGIGNLNSSSLYSGNFIFENELRTDNSYVFFLTTLGLVGLVLIIMILMKIYFKISLQDYKTKSVFFIWIATSLFEHTLFVPSSITSLFFLIYIIYGFQSKEMAYESNIYI